MLLLKGVQWLATTTLPIMLPPSTSGCASTRPAAFVGSALSCSAFGWLRGWFRSKPTACTHVVSRGVGAHVICRRHGDKYASRPNTFVISMKMVRLDPRGHSRPKIRSLAFELNARSLDEEARFQPRLTHLVAPGPPHLVNGFAGLGGNGLERTAQSADRARTAYSCPTGRQRLKAWGLATGSTQRRSPKNLRLGATCPTVAIRRETKPESPCAAATQPSDGG